MLAEGVPPAMIENAGRMAGMPVGPLSLNDEVAIDLGLEDPPGDQGASSDRKRSIRRRRSCWCDLVEKHGRLGRKNSKGFYDYPEGGKKRLWPGLADLQPTHLDPDTVDFAELKQRLLVTQALEAARTVEEGVITDPREADVGSILGFGFAPFTGGALSYIDFMGAKRFVDAVPQARSEARRALRAEQAPPRHGGERRHVLRCRGGEASGVNLARIAGWPATDRARSRC